MGKQGWGGARDGAGRPKMESPRKMRGLKFNDAEWISISKRAQVRGHLDIAARTLAAAESMSRLNASHRSPCRTK